MAGQTTTRRFSNAGHGVVGAPQAPFLHGDSETAVTALPSKTGRFQPRVLFPVWNELPPQRLFIWTINIIQGEGMVQSGMDIERLPMTANTMGETK